MPYMGFKKLTEELKKKGVKDPKAKGKKAKSK